MSGDETDQLRRLLEGAVGQDPAFVCPGCGGVRFVPCPGCGGSRKVFIEEEDRIHCCGECNENGLSSFGFVDYYDRRSAALAIMSLHGRHIDQVIPTVTDDSLENWREELNITEEFPFPAETVKSCKSQGNDQSSSICNCLTRGNQILLTNQAFTDLVHKVFGESVEGEDELVYSYDGKLKLGVLPASIFCSGHTYFVQGMHQQLRLEPYAMHTTFQYAGTEGKRFSHGRHM